MKCNWRNKVTTLRFLLKSHKCLKKHFPKFVLEKDHSKEFHEFCRKEHLMKSFLSKIAACNLTEHRVQKINVPASVCTYIHQKLVVVQKYFITRTLSYAYNSKTAYVMLSI